MPVVDKLNDIVLDLIRMKNWMGAVVFGFLVLALPITIFFTQRPIDLRQQAAGGQGIKTSTVGNLIVLALNQNLDAYQQLKNKATTVSYRTVNFDSSQETTSFVNKGYDYYITVASSDFIAYQSNSLYNYDLAALRTLASGPRFKGFYFHEMMTYRASVNDWDWNKARDTVDWGWVNEIMLIAREKGKKVIWSEPTYAWKTIYESEAVMPLLSIWGDTLIPMYANNFTDTETNSAQQYAALVATKYNLYLGISHQGWHWRSHNALPTRQTSFQILANGWSTNARFFQFEGTQEDMIFSSPYMQGVQDFARYLQKITKNPGIF